MMEIAGYFSLFLVGLSLGLFGSGGSMLSVPILVYLFSLDTAAASGYSLFVVGIASLSGFFMRAGENRFSWQVALLFGAPSVLGVYFSRKWLLPSIPDPLFETEAFRLEKEPFLLSLFASLMVVAACLMLREKEGRPKSGDAAFVLLPLAGLGSGCLAGVAGIGGGFVIIPILVYFGSLPAATAVGTTLLVITANSFIGCAGEITSHPVNWVFLAKISGMAIAGIAAGTIAGKNLPLGKFVRVFGWLLLLCGCGMLLRELFRIWMFGWKLSTAFVS